MTHPAHFHMIDLGYVHTHIEAHWEDVGNCETGPMVVGHNGFDQYESDNEVVYLSPEGKAGYEQFDEDGYPIKGSGW